MSRKENNTAQRREQKTRAYIDSEDEKEERKEKWNGIECE